jgi:hypothetical protein
MPPVRFEPTIPASARPQTCALDRAATGIGRDWSTEPNWLYRKTDRGLLQFVV